MPDIERAQVSARFYGNLGTVCEQLRRLVLRAAARDLMVGLLSEIPAPSSPTGLVKSIVELVNFVKWDQKKTLQTEHSPYVDTILLWMRKVYSSLQRQCLDGTNFSISTLREVWAYVAELCYRDLLSAYSNVKRFTTEGLALATLDLVMLKKGIDEHDAAATAAGVPADAYRALDGYIKAFYYDQESHLLEWVSHQASSYTLAQFQSLVNHGIGRSLKRKQRAALLSSVERIWKSNRG